MACAVAMLGFASCESDTDPRLNIPADHTFVLNTPAFADQYLELVDGNKFELTCSQPDYGYAATAVYGLQVALDDKFTQFETLAPEDPGLAVMTFADKDLATALCKLYGFDASTYEDLPAGKIYLRATCEIAGVEESKCLSNVIALEKVKFFHATQGARAMYVVGSINGWVEPSEANAEHYAKWTMSETETGSNIYIGSFKFPEGDATFRFYTALTGWEDASIGFKEADEATAVEATDGVYEGSCVKGKGSWTIKIPTECNVNLTVDMNAMTVKFEIGGEVNYDAFPCVYVVGNVEGWKGPDEANAAHYAEWKLYDIDNSGVYVSKPGAPFAYSLEEAPMFRIYTALTGWDGGDSLGYKEADEATEVELDGDTFSGPYVSGKGSWKFSGAPQAGTFSVKLDTNTKTLEVTFAAAAEEEE